MKKTVIISLFIVLATAFLVQAETCRGRESSKTYPIVFFDSEALVAFIHANRVSFETGERVLSSLAGQGRMLEIGARSVTIKDYLSLPGISDSSEFSDVVVVVRFTDRPGKKLFTLKSMLDCDKETEGQPQTVQQITFRLVDKSLAHDSLQTMKDLWLALMLQHTEGGQSFNTLLNQYVDQGRVKSLAAGTEVRLTNRATGMAAEVTIKGISGKWCIPVQALKDAKIPLPPLDSEYMRDQLH